MKNPSPVSSQKRDAVAHTCFTEWLAVAQTAASPGSAIRVPRQFVRVVAPPPEPDLMDDVRVAIHIDRLFGDG